MSQRTPEFERLLERHRGEIAAYLRRLLGDASAAEDAAQDTWLRAHRAFDRLPAEANTRAWLYRIATNRALTMLKQRRTALRRASPVDLDMIPARAIELAGGLTLRGRRPGRRAAARQTTGGAGGAPLPRSRLRGHRREPRLQCRVGAEPTSTKRSANSAYGWSAHEDAQDGTTRWKRS